MPMRGCVRAMLALALVLPAGAALGQDNRPPLPPPTVAHPTYASVQVEIEVDRPVNELWREIGRFCDISRWVERPCEIISGVDFQLGAVRLVNNRVVEMLVAQTALSYTYAYPVREGVPYNQAHGTVAAEPIGLARSRVIYSQMFDNSMLADDNARAADIADRRQRLTRALENMKRVVEAEGAGAGG